MRRAWDAARTAGLDALLVSAPADVRYLSGFTGSNGWLVVADSSTLITDARYTAQAALECPECDVVIAPGTLATEVPKRLAEGATRVGIDEGSLLLATWRALLGDGSVEWLPAGSHVRALRSLKDADEVAAIRRALRLAETVLVDVLEGARPGMTELGLAARLDYECRLRGATAMAFETIVAAGPRGALPHARPGDAVLAAGDLLVVDFGCVVDGYCSDITRAVVVGEGLDPEWGRIHTAVDAARAAAIAAVGPGVAARDVDSAAREVLAAAGLADAFVHSLGHGVGIEVHEAPRLAARSDDVLAAGMVVTVEPGVYLEGRGGVRLEDMVLVTESGAERLNGLDTAILRTRGGV